MKKKKNIPKERAMGVIRKRTRRSIIVLLMMVMVVLVMMVMGMVELKTRRKRSPKFMRC